MVADGPGPPLVLGDDPTGTEAKLQMVQQEVCEEDHPEPFLNHVAELFTEEGNVLFSGLVRPTFQGGNFAAVVPGPCVHSCRDAIFLVMGEQMLGSVR